MPWLMKSKTGLSLLSPAGHTPVSVHPKDQGAVIETKTGMPLPGVTVVAEIEGKPLTGTPQMPMGILKLPSRQI